MFKKLKDYFNKEKTTFLVSYSRFFLRGLEADIIMPSLILYLHSMKEACFLEVNSVTTNFGFVVASFFFSSIIACPIFGYIGDKTKTTKVAVLIGNLFEITGSFMYCFASNPCLLIASRFISGIGSGPGPVMLGMLNYATPKEKRTIIVSKGFAYRQFGSLIAPLCYIGLSQHVLFFWLGSTYINQYTIPTFFTGVLWILHTIMTLFLYFDLPAYEDDSEDCEENQNNSADLQNHSSRVEESLAKPESPEEKEPKSSFVFLRSIYNDLISEETIALIFNGFAMTFTHACVSTLITPFSLELFNWSGIQNSELFFGKNILYIVGFVVFSKLSKKFSNEMLVVCGQSGMILSSILFTIFPLFAFGAPKNSPWSLFVFIFYILIGSFFYPFSYAPLLPGIFNLTSEENKGFNVSVLMTFAKIGGLFGMIWSTSFVDFQIETLIAVNLVLTVLPWVMYLLSYKQFEKRRKYLAQKNKRESSGEEIPLLPVQSRDENRN